MTDSLNMRLPRFLPVVLGLLALPVKSVAAEKVRFNRDVRPILSDTCFHCHGPDEKERKGGLRLDVRTEALKPSKSGATAIVPGKPEQSEIITRIHSGDAEEVMPPPKLHKTLTTAQRETLRNWVAQGAEYEGHWAFIKPVRVAPPLDTPNPIDGFLRAKIAQAGLSHSPEAPREALIRRLTLDLTGLPPAPAEVAAFLADKAPGAYERLVDRLLASPSYGEHMAAPWLDLARYADSNGFQSDTSREMWHWRDWLIGAFNRNLPFDQFTIEQLAGDMLPQATQDQILATGFNRNHRLNGEGGRIVEEWFAETVIDRVETTGLTWMALTLNCCRCHDHKYDPVSQKEFYQLFSYFNSSDETGVLGEFGGSGETRKGGNTPPVLFLPTEEETRRLASLNAEAKSVETQLGAARKALPEGIAAWEKEFTPKLSDTTSVWTAPRVLEARSLGGATLNAQPDGSYLATGKNPANDSYELILSPGTGRFTGMLLEVLPEETLPSKSLGRSGTGNFVLTGVEVDLRKPGAAEPEVILLTRAEADYEQKGYEIAKIIDGQPKPAQGRRNADKKNGKPGWAVDGGDPAKKLARKALFVCEPVDMPEGSTLAVRLVHASPFGDHNIARFKIQTSALPAALLSLKGETLPESLKTALHTEPAKRTGPQRSEIEKFYIANTQNPVRQPETRLAELRKKIKDTTDSQYSSMIMKEMATPRAAFVLNRGEYDRPGAPVARALPAVLPPLPEGAPNDRLGLAKWLVSGEHPLTARVWVNRVWERLFGTGIVKTTENFGSQADWPSHPELLDWLATEFVRLNWDMKAMLRLIVTSAAYRQSTTVTPEHLAKDPENRLLARMPRLRLSAETLRDQALTVSGLLVDKIGGPSVRPYMPDAVWDETSVYGNLRNYKSDEGEGLYRRTLYTIWKRTAAPPSMLLFDSPSREICTVKRSRSNTPTQALALLNEITYVEAARKLAEGMLLQGGNTPEARVEWAFQRVLARKPDAFERDTVTRRLKARLDKLTPEEAAARQIISLGKSKPADSLAPAELAAYTVTANVLLNLDEAVTRP
jgi:hypothetical protein